MLRLWIALVLAPVLLLAEAIDDYRTTITVHPSGSLTVTEVIAYDFDTQERHGIFRDIPLTVKVDRYAPEVPIGLSDFSVRVDGHAVPFSQKEIASQSSGKMIRYRIGDPRHTLSGRHTYRLTYRIQRGVLPSHVDGMDAIRWNAVGAGSQVPTHHATAELILPNVLNRSQVRIAAYRGRYGSTDSRVQTVWLNDHRIRFETSELAPHEALTVEVNYPRGLLGQSSDPFKRTDTDRLLGNWHWGGVAGFFLFLWGYARRFGVEDRPGSIAPQYYPPPGLSLLQSGLILDKFADKEDFSAAILELGTLGYLEIHQESQNTTPIIQRTDKPIDADTLSEDQRYLFEAILFKEGDSYVVRAHDADRAEKLNGELEHLNALLYAWSVQDGYMRANPEKTRKTFLVKVGTIAALLSLVAIVTTVKYYGFGLVVLAIFGGLFVGIGFSVLLSGIRTKSVFPILFGGVWLAFSFIAFGSPLADAGGIAQLLTSPMILPFAVIGGTWYFYRRIGLLTPRGLEIYRYLLGYREFMQRVEQDRIRRFLAEDPHYLDRGLPYAVLFGLNTHWLSLYDALNVSPPYWYHGDLHHMDDFARSVQQETIAPASESGGFSGGGSFAGGGGGGGGVGSW